MLLQFTLQSPIYTHTTKTETKGAFRPVPFGAVVPKQGAFPPKD